VPKVRERIVLAYSSHSATISWEPTDCTIVLQANDLTGDPGLDAFADNGSPGNAHFPLLSTSQAIDAADPQVCPELDQLGNPRIGICDIGAVEANQAMAVIDVKPHVDPNKINPQSHQSINVAVFSLNGFDATSIDPTTVRFGATGTEAFPVQVRFKDVDLDGNRDLVLRFRIQDTGIKCGDTSVTLTGQLLSGTSIGGSSPITTIPCKKKQLSAVP
jgi:hypothetical protein